MIRQRGSDFDLFDESLFEELALLILHATSLVELRDELHGCIKQKPISWTRCRATLAELQRNLDAEAQDLGALPWRDVSNLIKCCQQPDEWQFLLFESVEFNEHFEDIALHTLRLLVVTFVWTQLPLTSLVLGANIALYFMRLQAADVLETSSFTLIAFLPLVLMEFLSTLCPWILSMIALLETPPAVRLSNFGLKALIRVGLLVSSVAPLAKLGAKLVGLKS